MSAPFISPDNQKTNEYKNHYIKLYIVVAVATVMIIARLWYLQIIIGPKLRETSDRNRIKSEVIVAPRGVILDRNYKVLGSSRPSQAVHVTPQYIKDIDPLTQTLSDILSIPRQQIIKKIQKGKKQNGPSQPILIKKHLSLEEIYKLKRIQWEYSGLEIKNHLTRTYPLKSVAGTLLGYTGKISQQQMKKYRKQNKAFKKTDIVGKSGIESLWEDVLKGQDGRIFTQVDSRGRHTFLNEHSHRPTYEPRRGKDLVLTIDADIQQVTHDAMFRSDKYGNRIGTALVIKTNGEILSWVSLPSFDPNRFSKSISSTEWRELLNDPLGPLRNKPVQDAFPPGSTFKPFVALAALQEKIISPTTSVHAPGSMDYGSRTYHDARKAGHGYINVMQAIERSSNIFFYKMGMSLGIDRISQYAKLFGLGTKTGLKIPGERSGLVPTKKWKKEYRGSTWQPGEDLIQAIGQGYLLVTPLQLAKAYNTVALHGKMYRPSLVKKIIEHNPRHITRFLPFLEKDISIPRLDGEPYIEKKYFKVVETGLRNVFEGKKGSVKWLRSSKFSMAGKTGTAQSVSSDSTELYGHCLKKPLNKRHHAWFVGYAPVENPQITVVIFAERGCSGPGGAAPIFREIVKKYFQKYPVARR